jgi:hypothetical protein
MNTHADITYYMPEAIVDRLGKVCDVVEKNVKTYKEVTGNDKPKIFIKADSVDDLRNMNLENIEFYVVPQNPFITRIDDIVADNDLKEQLKALKDNHCIRGTKRIQLIRLNMLPKDMDTELYCSMAKDILSDDTKGE